MIKRLRIKEHTFLTRIWAWRWSTLLVAGLSGFIVISSCEEQVTEPLMVAAREEAPLDERLQGNEAVIQHDNPETGKPYTDEELAALSYDPSKEEHYNPGGNVSLDIVMKLAPQKIEVLTGDNKVLTELDIPVANEDNEYVANFSSNFDDLGFGQGEDRMLSFTITYNNAVGNQAASVQTLDFEFHLANIRPRALAFFKNGLGETFEIKTQVTGAASELSDKYGHVFTFDGADDFITLIDSEDLAFRHEGDFSISIWINTTSSNSDPVIIGDKDWGSGGNKGFLFAHIGSKWKLNLGDGNGSRRDLTGGEINDGTWHHLAASFDRDGDVVIYQDGVEMGRTDMSAVGDMNSGYPLRLAQDGTSSYGLWYEGMTGEPTIFDYVLSAGEVTGMNESLEQFSVQLRKQDGTAIGLSVDDASSGVAAEFVNGKERIVRTFNGDPDFSTIQDEGALDFRFGGDFSVAVWVNTSASNSDPVIIGDKDWGSGGNKGFLLAHIGSNWKLNAGDGNGQRIDASGPDINDGAWHLIGVTFDRDGDAVIYQDGEAVGNVAMGAVGDMTSGYPIRLAQDGTGSYGLWYEGKTSTAYTFDYALSAAEMQALYTE
ncbi:MAG: LamG domain-containing protein [Cyclobacteriaceae bacterium]